MNSYPLPPRKLNEVLKKMNSKNYPNECLMEDYGINSGRFREIADVLSDRGFTERCTSHDKKNSLTLTTKGKIFLRDGGFVTESKRHKELESIHRWNALLSKYKVQALILVLAVLSFLFGDWNTMTEWMRSLVK